MALRNIVTVGDPVLTKTCRPVVKFDDRLAELIEDMKETMQHANGVGLAAPQVGVLRRIVVVDAGDEIVELVNRKGNISFAQLKEAFPSVSEMTLRTDLKALDEARRVVRVHGGVKSVEQVVGTDDLLSRRSARNAEAKQLIAEKAAALLRPNTTLFLDSGSTATAVARCIPDQPMLIYTSGLSCAMELAKLEKPHVSLPGGSLNRFSMSVCGAQSIQTMEEINFDLLLLGVTSYSPDTGFTCGVEDEARLKQTVLRRCEQKAVLLDSSKIGLKSTFHICDLSEVDIIISDGKLPAAFLQACRNAGVTVL